jgi:hypothetical protein
MSLFSRLFGGGETPRQDARAPEPAPCPPPDGEKVAAFTFAFLRRRKTQRRVAEQFLLAPGTYELYLRSSGEGAYAPMGAYAPLPEGGWHNVVHMALCAPFYPLEKGEGPAPATLPHRVFRNADRPGPFALRSEARAAFRLIRPEERQFTLTQAARVIFWIEGDNDIGGGDMQFDLFKLA